MEKTIDEIWRELYKKTLYYGIDGIRINEDGTCTRIRSDAYMEKHPEAERETDEIFSEEEIKYMNSIVKQLNKKEKFNNF